MKLFGHIYESLYGDTPFRSETPGTENQIKNVTGISEEEEEDQEGQATVSRLE